MKNSFLLILFLLPIVAGAQMKKANEAFDHHHYDEAIMLYEQAIRKDLDNDEAITKLALCFWKTDRWAEAEYWFTRAAMMNEDPQVKLWYSQILIANEKYDLAITWLEKYIAVESDREKVAYASQLQAWTKGIASGALSKKHYKVNPMPFNTEDLDFAPFLFDGKLYFASNRKEALKKAGENDPWTNERFTDLFVVDPTHETAQATVASEFPLTVYHDGPLFIHSSGNEAYLTTTDVASGKRGFDDQNNTRLGIIRLKKEGSAWVKTKPLSFNNNNYNIAHAALSTDGNTLYFSSDMPGGMGGMDIYACVRNADDSWGKPTNLGSKINTSGNEVFPTIHNNMLYFSSDYHPGFGGLDVFYIPLDGSAMAENAGLPMNSPKDDFGLCFEPDGKTGYFTSNRNSANKDDIYFFTMETGYHIHGTLLDCLTHAPVPQARVDLLGADGSMVTTFTDSLGEYSYTVYNRSEFELMARHEMYTSTDGCSGKYALTTEGMFDGQVLETVLALDPMEAANLQQAFLCGRVMHSIYGNPLAEVQVCVQHGQDEFEVTTTASGAFFVPVSNGAEVQIDVTRTAFEELTTSLTVVKSQDQCHAVDIAMVPNRLAEPPLLTPEIIVQPGMVIELYHVYFDRDQHELREDAMPDLRTFLQILRDNPGVSGVLSAHTDSRASDKYNYDLSVRRAKAVYDYLVANGISADRLTARGFGESQPINHCIDGVNCSEQEHQRNRRVEFEVVDVNKKLNSKSEEPAVFTDSVD